MPATRCRRPFMSIWSVDYASCKSPYWCGPSGFWDQHVLCPCVSSRHPRPSNRPASRAPTSTPGRTSESAEESKDECKEEDGYPGRQEKSCDSNPRAGGLSTPEKTPRADPSGSACVAVSAGCLGCAETATH